MAFPKLSDEKKAFLGFGAGVSPFVAAAIAPAAIANPVFGTMMLLAIGVNIFVEFVL